MSTIQQQIEALETMNMKELQAEFERVTGAATRVPNKVWLVRKITEALETKAAGEPTQPELEQAEGHESEADASDEDNAHESTAGIEADEIDSEESAPEEAEVADAEDESTEQADETDAAEEDETAIREDAGSKPETSRGVASPPSGRDPRLPPVGTVIIKRDRHRSERCRCTVTADGIEYRGKVYGSISAAGAAAAMDLGLKGAINGFLFWLGGTAKKDPSTPRAPKVKARAMAKAWDRYLAAAKEAVSTATDETRSAVQAEIEAHEKALDELLKPAE